ncbi:MAG: bifunctional phosphoserine phosphatase/homoserine phosphotransferase ThrH [Propionibacteriaceae bacterium]
MRPELVCLDLEGVLVPEIWISVAERTGIPELRRTTRDEPDYDALMRYRLDILDRHGLRLTDIQDVIATLEPLPGAVEFLGWLRESFSGVLILSDTFAEFAQPLMRQLGWPTLFCHSLEVGDDGRIIGYRLRMPDQKKASVQALQAVAFRVIAAGDSYNDTAMLLAADAGILFDPPQNVVDEFRQLPVARGYEQLKAEIAAASTRAL